MNDTISCDHLYVISAGWSASVLYLLAVMFSLNLTRSLFPSVLIAAHSILFHHKIFFFNQRLWWGLCILVNVLMLKMFIYFSETSPDGFFLINNKAFSSEKNTFDCCCRVHRRARCWFATGRLHFIP